MSWTFLSNHGHIMVQIARNPEIRISDLARIVGVTERHASGIVNDLRDAGYLEVEKQGRRNFYRINGGHALRHDAESNQTLSDLLGVFKAP